MGMTRSERFQRKRDLEKVAGIGAEGLKVSANPAFKCDECREAVGTLYAFDVRLLCINHVPFEYQGGGRKHMKLFSKVVSGREAILAKRRAMSV